jgi:hypothetical protein
MRSRQLPRRAFDEGSLAGSLNIFRGSLRTAVAGRKPTMS